jgi:phosphate ABC transporter phosphate-binding protein
MRLLAVCALLCAVIGAVGCGGATPSQPEINGQGSTFVSPLMVQWSAVYQKTENGCPINYAAYGSGDGIKALIANKVDFACTEAPLTDAEVAKIRESGDEVIHVPLVLGAVVPVYNLAEVSEPLRFSGAVLADIYLGKIKKWNDAAIKALNPQIADRLPEKDIVVVHRADGSGTTYVWADYLAKISPEWNNKVGVATDLNWPTGEKEPGNNGVAKRVQSTPASIGYVELSYAHRLDLAMGLVENREKEFTKARLESIRRSVESAMGNIPDDLRYSITDAPGKGAFPICGTTWAVVRTHQPHDKGQRLVDFLYWATDAGQENAELLLYLRLPDPILERARKKIAAIHVADR